MTTEKLKNKHVTILLTAGLIDPATMQEVTAVAKKYDLSFYVTTAQNIRLIGATEENLVSVKQELTSLGLTLKAPGKFPVPKVCVGMPYCNLGLADTFSLAKKITAAYGNRTEVKQKFKISVSGCPACCGGSKLADIGIIATRNGFELYAGGKGGPLPKTSVRLAKGLSEEEVVEAVGKLADFHAEHTPKKLRMFKLMEMDGFPKFPAE